MKIIVTIIVLLASSVLAVGADLPCMVDSEYIDSETSTNEVFTIEGMDGYWFRVIFEINTQIDNTFLVEFGKDGNTDGLLSRDEIDLSLGWMSGKLFLKDHDSRVTLARDLNVGPHRLECRFRLVSNQSNSHFMVRDGSAVISNQSIPFPFRVDTWNLVRVVRRGVSSGVERISYSRFNLPFRIIVR